MKQHVKVLLATGRIEHYYYDRPRLLDDFLVVGAQKEVLGYKFCRPDSEDFFSFDMVKGVGMGPFKGYMLNVDGLEIFSASPRNEDVIAALEAYRKSLEDKLKATKEYLSCKLP